MAAADPGNNTNKGWRRGNFLYPYARALMLAGGIAPNADTGLYWSDNNQTAAALGALGNKSPFRVMFLNAGVGTAYVFQASVSSSGPGAGGGGQVGANNVAGSDPGGAGFAVSGYAWNPVVNDADNELLSSFTPAIITVNDQFRGTSDDAAGQSLLGEGRFAGSIVTSLNQIPQSHRTFCLTAPFTANHPFGGTANTAIVAGTSITYNGVADANNVTVYAVPSGVFVSAFVLYRIPNNAPSASYASTGQVDQNSLLIAYFDSATGLPVQGNGGDISVVWDDGPNKIFKI